MKEFWNERYAAEEYAYGKDPNVYLKDKLKDLKPGSILLPCDGEGRNGVYAAVNGWKVTSFDQSEKGKEKALQLANSQNVEINYYISSVEEINLKEKEFDLLVFIYAHFPEKVRENYHKKLTSYLKPGGYLIMESYNKNQIEYQKKYNSGGPQSLEMLYLMDDLKNDFNDFTFLEATESETILHEGKFHEGKASILRLFARKN